MALDSYPELVRTEARVLELNPRPQEADSKFESYAGFLADPTRLSEKNVSSCYSGASSHADNVIAFFKSNLGNTEMGFREREKLKGPGSKSVTLKASFSYNAYRDCAIKGDFEIIVNTNHPDVIQTQMGHVTKYMEKNEYFEIDEEPVITIGAAKSIRKIPKRKTGLVIDLSMSPHFIDSMEPKQAAKLIEVSR